METLNNVEQAIEDAKEDVKAENAFGFLILGFVFPILGILIAALYNPAPKTQRFDNPSDYVEAYKNEFISRKRRKNIEQAAVGFVLGVFALFIIFMAIVSSP